MVSPETVNILTNLQSNQGHYSAHSSELRTYLANKTLIQLVGPTASGKSTIMDAASNGIDGLSIVGTGTTREPRESDHPSRYHYLPHTDEGVRSLSQMIERGDIVQYYVTSDQPHYVYWSEPRDYDSAYNIGDYFSGVIESFTSYGFKQTIPISIVRDVEPWITAVGERFPVGSEHRIARLKEAVSSIMWSLSQSEFTHSWLISREGDMDQTVHALTEVIDGQHPDDNAGKKLARDCLHAAQMLLESEQRS